MLHLHLFSSIVLNIPDIVDNITLGKNTRSVLFLPKKENGFISGRYMINYAINMHS